MPSARSYEEVGPFGLSDEERDSDIHLEGKTKFELLQEGDLEWDINPRLKWLMMDCNSRDPTQDETYLRLFQRRQFRKYGASQNVQCRLLSSKTIFIVLSRRSLRICNPYCTD